MTDTNHIEQRARELLAAECDRTVEGMHYDAYGVVTLHVALSAIRRALSARASAGEGGESEPPKYHCQNGSGHVCLAASLRPGNVVCPHDECDIDTGVFEMPTATPQPAQAGASGGGEVVELLICEVPHLMLRRDQLYRFTVDPNCEACRDAAAFGTAPASPATGQDFEAWFAKQDSRTEWRELVRLAYYATPQPESARGEWARLRELSEAASENWTMGRNGVLNGVLLGGAVQQFVRGSGQTQIAMFTSPNYNGEIDRDPAAEQRANTEFALACVTYVRAMLAAAPQPQQAPAQECGANGAGGCSYRPCGPIGESQCQFCGAPPAHGDGEGLLVHVGDALSHAFPEDIAEWKRVCRIVYPFLRERLTTRPAPEAQEARDACVWAFDDDDRAPMWNSACGEAWSFTEGGPEDNNYRYCHGCGKPIAALALPAQGEGNRG